MAGGVHGEYVQLPLPAAATGVYRDGDGRAGVGPENRPRRPVQGAPAAQNHSLLEQLRHDRAVRVRAGTCAVRQAPLYDTQLHDDGEPYPAAPGRRRHLPRARSQRGDQARPAQARSRQTTLHLLHTGVPDTHLPQHDTFQ